MGHLNDELAGLRWRGVVARLATVRPDGHPHVVPITFALQGDIIVTVIDHKPKTTTNLQRLKNIDAHPFASVVFDRYDEEWSSLWWVGADGNARIVTEGQEHGQAIGWLVAKYPQYQSQSAPGAGDHRRSDSVELLEGKQGVGPA